MEFLELTISIKFKFLKIDEIEGTIFFFGRIEWTFLMHYLLPFLLFKLLKTLLPSCFCFVVAINLLWKDTRAPFKILAFVQKGYLAST